MSRIRVFRLWFLSISICVSCYFGFSQKEESLEIPEPLMFDLVRGLGAKQGGLEINTLVHFPLNDFNGRGVEWAPEIEYALFDGFAVEVEFPFENRDLEAFKLAVQWTIGASNS